ncbi:GNAT family N-acetyltransferase [Thalassospira lucentensis]|uniref:GNAT family N-acetyltransferase n=1 Tax=Thalassospira lucentensis TaxID=168935 RepID=UPI003D2EACE8
MTYFAENNLIGLRGVKREDLLNIRRWMENPEATRYMETGWRPIPDKELEAAYDSFTNSSENVVFVIDDKVSGESVGFCGIYLIQWICRRGEFRILIGKTDALGKGLGTAALKEVVGYAFDKLNLETLYLGVNTENTRAVCSYEKVGFQKEGVRRQIIYRNGRYYDAYMMSLLRSEYEKSIKE